MQLNNPTNQDRLCVHLGENLAPFGVRSVPDDFEKCPECRCVVFGEAAESAPEPESAPEE